MGTEEIGPYVLPAGEPTSGMDTIRCCIACILPCGALDVVRIVHSNGRVEEISRPVLAGEIMKAYPKHVLRKPPSTCPADGGGGGIVVQKPVILPPNAELQKGKIYFLMPVMAPPEKEKEKEKAKAAQAQAPAAARRRRRRKETADEAAGGRAASNAAAAPPTRVGSEGEKERLLANERYLSEIMKEKASTARDRRRGRVAVWRPHLESITEDDL